MFLEIYILEGDLLYWFKGFSLSGIIMVVIFGKGREFDSFLVYEVGLF